MVRDVVSHRAGLSIRYMMQMAGFRHVDVDRIAMTSDFLSILTWEKKFRTSFLYGCPHLVPNMT